MFFITVVIEKNDLGGIMILLLVILFLCDFKNLNIKWISMKSIFMLCYSGI